MERCVRCNVLGNEVKLFDAVHNGKIIKICERCSIIENIPVIKKPSASQLKESEKSMRVYDRMKRLMGLGQSKSEETFFLRDKLKELDNNPWLERPEEKPLELIDFFYWEIMKTRRRKGLSQKQLANYLGESEKAIQMMEKGNLPENPRILVDKLERFLHIRLRKISEAQRFLSRKESKPVLLNEFGRELGSIPEPAIEYYKKTDEYDEDGEESEEGTEPPEDVNLDEIDKNKTKISDLMKLHRKKIKATKQEKIEEQKKIEERQKLIEARREELRLKRETESRELDRVLGGSELLGRKEFKDIEKDFNEDEELI